MTLSNDDNNKRTELNIFCQLTESTTILGEREM